jgi:hypothetical protein
MRVIASIVCHPRSLMILVGLFGLLTATGCTERAAAQPTAAATTAEIPMAIAEPHG